jgi:hypothetical protein
MAKPIGYILYEGPSMLDGKPIVAIATVGSQNAKTGGMVQTWIIRSDIEPHTALKNGDDYSVCGNCKHRPVNGGACYVTVFQAPLAVYRAYKRGRYARAEWSGDLVAVGEGRAVRLGSYGDPAAVPVNVWRALVQRATGTTGYTHQWHKLQPGAALSALCMASVDTAEEREMAKMRGWRTFRVRTADESTAQGESVCPASDEGGTKLTCSQCKACNGCATGRKGDIVIQAHGAASKVKAFIARRTAVV